MRLSRGTFWILCLVLIAGQFVTASSSIVLAQRVAIEPRDVALTPADLPSGFSVTEDQATPMDPGPGVMYSVTLKRPVTGGTVGNGPVWVSQLIGRFDGPVAYEGFLDTIRQRFIDEKGYQLVPGAPNDGGTASLMWADGDGVGYMVGFIKRDMVIFTGWAGAKGAVDLQGVLTLAGVSSARYDQVLASGGMPATASTTTTHPSEGVATQEAAPPKPTEQPTPPPRTASAAPPAPKATIDQRVLPALRALYAIKSAPVGGLPWGDWFRAIVDRSAVTIAAAPLPRGTHGVYRGRSNTLTIGTSALNEDVRSVASVLGHELTHVAQALENGGVPGDCVSAEVEAFRVGLSVFVNLFGGPSPGRTSFERSQNLVAYRWLTEGDPILYKFVVDTPGYQDQCSLWVP
ncbi:MAG: hypothetical protein IT305_14265 [Chloroflexi bacterium]|nr:hypothetical protein [Chloroflexota bacterium]